MTIQELVRDLRACTTEDVTMDTASILAQLTRVLALIEAADVLSNAGDPLGREDQCCYCDAKMGMAPVAHASTCPLLVVRERISELKAAEDIEGKWMEEKR